MSDDFEKAILISFDQTGSVNAALKTQAQAFLSSTQQSQDFWRLCLTRLESSPYVEVRFWCLQSLHELIQGHLPSEASSALKIELLQLGSVPLPQFLRNKLSQCLVALAACEYPEHWPHFFQDLLSAMQSGGTPAVEFFTRVLISLDEDIICLEVPRSAEEARRSMAFKDAMREGALKDIVDAWYSIIANCQTSSPEIAARVLSAASRYVPWIDVNLVANDRFVPLLYSVLQSPCEELRGAASDFLSEIVTKRMEPVPKLTLIQQLGVVPLCSGWATHGLPDDTSALKYAQLLASLATEVLESLKKIENSIVSMQAVGLEVDAEATAEASVLCTTAHELLALLVPPVLRALQMGDVDVISAVLPFLLSFVARLKTATKRDGGTLPTPALQQIPAMYQSITAAARFPDSHETSWGPGQGAADQRAIEEEEEELEMNERRNELFTLFRNTAKLSPETANTYVSQLLAASLQNKSSTSWQDVELALTLLYQLGEGLNVGAHHSGGGGDNNDVKYGISQLTQLAVGVMQADIPCADQKLVALSLLEVFVRYARMLNSEQLSPALLHKVLSTFLGPHGIGHPSGTVSRRACYLFSRLVKQLRSQLRPFTPDLLQRLQPYLTNVASSPLAKPEDASDGMRSHSGRSMGPVVGTSAVAQGQIVDDRLYVFDAAGLLLGSEHLQEADQIAWLQAVLQPLIVQIESNINAAISSSDNASSYPAALIQQALESITRISKGFHTRLCLETRPEIGTILAGALNAAIAIPRRLPHHKVLRAKFLSLLHRMVETLGHGVIPSLINTLEALLYADADIPDVLDVLVLLNQFMARFKAVLAPLMSEILPALVTAVHALLETDWDWSGAATVAKVGVALPEDVRERGDLQRGYVLHLNTIAHNELAGVILEGNPDTRSAVLEALARTAEGHVDPGTRKTAISTLSKLTDQWLQQRERSSELLPGFRRFILERLVVGACLQGLLGGSVDARDAGAISLSVEVANALRMARERCGREAFDAHIMNAPLPPQLDRSQDFRRRLISCIDCSSENDGKQLRDLLREELKRASER